MLKIKLSIPGFNQVDISQFTGNSLNVVDDCIFFINQDDVSSADFWVCLEGPYKREERCKVSRDNIFFMSAEVAWPKFYYDNELKKNFLAQFARIYTCHDIYANNVTFDLPYLPWMINSNHGQSIYSYHWRDCEYLKNLTLLPKPKVLSVFCSNQEWTDDHKLRLKFVRHLKSYFGDRLDWFGNGVNTLDQKWDGIAQYKYHIVLENQSRNNVITEKLYDSFLALAHPIYYGAPNAAEYFDPNSFSTIDIVDIKGSIQKIETIIESDRYQQSLPALIESKDRVLAQFNMFQRIARVCTESFTARLYPTDHSTEIILYQPGAFDVKQDVLKVLKTHQYQLLWNRLALYYPGHLLKKIGNRLLRRYEEK